MTIFVPEQTKSTLLYENDFELWLEQTINQLKSQQFEQLDIEHLIEELTDLGKSNKRSLESNLMILIAHLLKLKIQQDAPEIMKGSWLDSVSEHRQRVLYDLQEIPSLKSHLETAIAKVYPSSRKLAIKEGKRAKFGVRVPLEKEYPLDCPFIVEQILDEDFEGVEFNHDDHPNPLTP
jgi:hypothetical protein